MPLPTSPTWDIANFDETSIDGLLTLGPGDLTILPTTTPYFGYTNPPQDTVLFAQSDDGNEASLQFTAAIPEQFSVEFTARFPRLPHNQGSLNEARLGLSIADTAGRGITIYFAKTGVAISRVNDLDGVTSLPDTTDLTSQIQTDFRTIRVVVDGTLGRAYVFVGDQGVEPQIRFILPVEATPFGGADLFKMFALGSPQQSARAEIVALRVGAGLIMANYPPTADAGPDQVKAVGLAIRLDGRGSFDIEGAPITYAWSVVDVPYGSQYVFESGTGSTVDEGDADGFTDTLSFPSGILPGWVSPGDIVVISDLTHVIDTVAVDHVIVTTETIPDNLSGAAFRIIRQSLLIGPTTDTPYFVPDVVGIYRFRLVVNDGVSDSEPSEVLASVVASRAPLGIEPDVSPIWKGLGDDWNFVEGREMFEEAWRGAAQIVAGKMLEVWQYHYNYSLRDVQRVFQRKWIAYRTLIAEPEPDAVSISPRYGALLAEHQFEVGPSPVVGQTLTLLYPSGETLTAVASRTVTFTGTSLSQIIADINTELAGTGITAYGYGIRTEDTDYTYRADDGSTTDDGDGDRYTARLDFTAGSLPSWAAAGDALSIEGYGRFTIATINNAGGFLTVTGEDIPDYLSAVQFHIYRRCRLGIKAQRAFSIDPDVSTAAVTLGFSTDTFNYLRGTQGLGATDRTYFAGDGYDLTDRQVERGDLLVANGGQSFRIDRVLDNPRDPMANQRLLLLDPLPLDMSETWDIPSVVTGTVDYEHEGSYPGDFVKFTVYDNDLEQDDDASGVVVAQKGMTIAADLNGLFGALVGVDERYEIRMVGVKRRKGVPIYDDIVSIPRLQDVIPLSAEPTYWTENVNYVLEPFYRESDGSAIPMLQFRDGTFDVDEEPPDILWAELTVFNNEQNVEDRFGRMVGFLRDDASKFGRDFNYVAGVAGLTYAQEGGPNLFSMHVGAQILLGQPFAEVTGTIEEIRTDFSPESGRILVRDESSDPTYVSEVVRAYYYKKDPLDTAPTSGIALNPDTNAPWAVGDTIKQFYPIGGGVDVVDMYSDPTWYLPYVRSGLMSEVEKFHSFTVRFNLALVDVSNLALLFQFITRVKPSRTNLFIAGGTSIEDELDPIDSYEPLLIQHLYDSLCGQGRAYMYDDYRGDGTIWSLFDDGSTYYDALIDCPIDVIDFVLTMEWAGGVITYDSIWYLNTDVVDVDGNFGPPGDTFTPTYDMTVPAGSYSLTVPIKSGGVVFP